MAVKYRIYGDQFFTTTGRLGAFLFVVCPFISTYMTMWWIDRASSPYSGAQFWPGLFATIATILSLASVPMMLIGRVQEYRVET